LGCYINEWAQVVYSPTPLSIQLIEEKLKTGKYRFKPSVKWVGSGAWGKRVKVQSMGRRLCDISKIRKSGKTGDGKYKSVSGSKPEVAGQ